ncbi:hypothetical protein [aff. Roholtiella sp. LEGE 12411]|uniref:hypothetical protein n=1 Tax=aff. Roholtiella sp. LEGE 12411 TaxID=1828822 RepID=UPI0018808772|nr:hypothetical protein [aff. Roholtiella sp. LEGE 12411]MBE9036566.1 hypothetical protein [aff. Roholtiella sp. LEGE 12411]
MTLVRFLASYQRIQQALQWWSSRQSMRLFLEAEKIREGLLQESFTIRRSLDLLAIDNVNLSINKTQECLKQVDSFHHSLVQLSDRLFPAYLQDSLPLAIECLLEPWLVSNPHLYFDINMPAYWRHEPADRSLVVLRALEELLIITLPEVLMPISIYITLQEQKNIGQLMVQITYPDTSTFIFYSNLPELKYLCGSFQFLTSGKSFYRSQNLSIACYLCW